MSMHLKWECVIPLTHHLTGHSSDNYKMWQQAEKARHAIYEKGNSNKIFNSSPKTNPALESEPVRKPQGRFHKGLSQKLHFFFNNWVLNRAELHILRTAKDTLWDFQITWREVHHLLGTTADPKGSTEVSGIIGFISGISLHNVKVPGLRQVLRQLWPSTPPSFHSWDFYLATSGSGSTRTLMNRKKRHPFHFTYSSCEISRNSQLETGKISVNLQIVIR